MTFSNAISNIFDVIINVLNYKIPINAAPAYSKAYAANHSVPFWLLIAAFALLFSVVWLGASYITLFKKPENKRQRTVFAIAVSIISLFGTPLAIWLMWLVYTFTLLTLIAVLIVGAYIIWTMTKSSLAEGAKTNSASGAKFAEAKAENAQNAAKNAETERKKEGTKQYKEATGHAAQYNLKSQLAVIRNAKSVLKTLLSDLYKVKQQNNYPVNPASVVNISKKISTLRTEMEQLGTLTSFTTKNDRALSMMSTASYEEGAMPASGLNSLTASNRAALSTTVETQTNDFAHSINAIKDTLNNGITDDKAVNNMINWTDAAINIASRMERDICLQQTQIEKLG